MRTSQKGLKRVEAFIVETDGPNKWIADVTCFRAGLYSYELFDTKAE